MAKRDETCRNCRQIFLLRGILAIATVIECNYKHAFVNEENARHPKRLPFLLKCGHTLCGVCISTATRKSKDVITCTDCGVRNKLPVM